MKCSNCGKEVQANWNICPECGAKLQNTVVATTHSEEKIKKPIYKKWWFWVLLIIGLGIISSIEEELGNSDEPSVDDINSEFIAYDSENNKTQRYMEITIEDLERNPNMYVNKAVAFTGTVYIADVNNKDWIWNITSDNAFNIPIIRKCIATDENGKHKGYLVTGDKCAVGGVLKYDQYNKLYIETEKVIILEE